MNSFIFKACTMNQFPNGTVSLVNLPSSWSLLVRSWTVYKALLPRFLYLSGLFFLGFLINISLTSFLASAVAANSDLSRSFVAVINTAIGIGMTVYFSFVIASTVYLIKAYLHGQQITVSQSFAYAKEKFLSLFAVGLIYGFVVYGGLLGIVLPALFSVWYYFSLYVVLVEDERGFAALARSHYLVRGMFFRVLGRYAVIAALFVLLTSLDYLLLAVPVIGWILFIVGGVALVLFFLPYYMTYDYLRFEDIVAVDRTVEYQTIGSEKAMLIIFAVLGCILSLLIWTGEVLTPNAKTAVQSRLQEAVAAVAIPFIAASQENADIIANFLIRTGIAPQQSFQKSRAPQSLTEPSLNSYDSLNTEELNSDYYLGNE